MFGELVGATSWGVLILVFSIRPAYQVVRSIVAAGTAAVPWYVCIL